MLQPLNQAHEAEQILRQACNTRQSKPKWSQTKFRTKPAEQHLTWWLNKSQGYAKLKRPCAVRIKRLRNCGFTLPVLAFFFFKKKSGRKKRRKGKTKLRTWGKCVTCKGNPQCSHTPASVPIREPHRHPHFISFRSSIFFLSFLLIIK